MFNSRFSGNRLLVRYVYQQPSLFFAQPAVYDFDQSTLTEGSEPFLPELQERIERETGDRALFGNFAVDLNTGVIALIPHVDGLASALTYPLRFLPRALALAVVDLVRGILGVEPLRVPVVARDGFAALPGKEAWDGFRLILPQGVHLPDDPGRHSPEAASGSAASGSGPDEWDGRVPARILLKILFDRPGRVCHRIRVPVLVQAAEEDGLIPLEAVRHAAGRITDVELQSYPMDHFGPYREAWHEPLIQAEIAFLQRVAGSGDG